MAKQKAHRKRAPRKKKRVTYRKKRVSHKRKRVTRKKRRKMSKVVQKGGFLASALGNALDGSASSLFSSVSANPMLWFTDKMFKYGLPAGRQRKK